MKQCQKCGSSVEDGAVYCTNCGEQLDSVVASMSAGTSVSPMGVSMPPVGADAATVSDGVDVSTSSNGMSASVPSMEVSGSASSVPPLSPVLPMGADKPMSSAGENGAMSMGASAPMSPMGASAPTPVVGGQPAATTMDSDALSQSATIDQLIAENPIGGQQPGIITNSQSLGEGSNKKKLDPKMLTLIIVSVVSVIIGIVGIILAIIGFSQGKSGEQVATGNSQGGSSVVDVTVGGTKVSFSGFELVMPKGYDYEIQDIEGTDVLGFSDSDAYLAMTTYRGDLPFSVVKSKKDALADEFSRTFGRVVNGVIRTVDGAELVYYNIGIVEGANVIYVFSNAELHSFMTIIMTEVGDDGTQYFENVAKVLKTAQRKTSINRSINGSGFGEIRLPNINITIQE